MDFLARYIFTFMPPVHQMPVDFKAADVPGQWIELGVCRPCLLRWLSKPLGKFFPLSRNFALLCYITYIFLPYLVVDSSTFPWNLYPGYWTISYSLIIDDKCIMWLTRGHIDVGISSCRSPSFHPWTVGCVCHLSSLVVLDGYHLPTIPWTLVPWVKETFP